MPPSGESAEHQLTQLLHRVSSVIDPTPYPSEVRLLAENLTPGTDRTLRSLAYLCLSKLCAGPPADADRNARLAEAFRPVFDDWLADVPPETLIAATALLAALFPLSPATGVSLLTDALATPSLSPETQDENQVDALAVLLETAELPSPLQPVFAELLASAAGTKQGRELMRTRKEVGEWLHGALDFGEDKALGALCAVALSKQSREEQVQDLPGQEASGSGGGQESGSGKAAIDELALADKMAALIISPPSNTSTLVPTLEGLSVLSLKPIIKQHLASAPGFLASLLSLSPVPRSRGGSLPITPRGSISDPTSLEVAETSLCYGITTILVNLTSRRPVVSAEDQQIAKLRAMAISGKKGGSESEPEDDPLDSDEAVRARVKLVLKAGGVGALSGLIRADSRLVKEGLGRLCLNLVEDQGDRPAFVRDGGFKVLSAIVRDLMTAATSKAASSSSHHGATTGTSTIIATASATAPEVDVLPAFQALAKMTITTPPHLLFPPPHTTTALNALTPLYHLLLHAKSSLLQIFEALMALTNLASIDPSIADRIVSASIVPLGRSEGFLASNTDEQVSVVSKVEELMLEENTLVRRAATELVCNLVPSPTGWSYWSGEDNGSGKDSGNGKDNGNGNGRDNAVDVGKGSEANNGRKPVSNSRAASRLNVILALTNVDDLPTRLAAGGALAIITESPSANHLLLTSSASVGDGKRSAWSRVLSMLEPDKMEDESGERITVISSTPPNPDLVHRGVIVLLNMLQYVSSLDEGGEQRQRVIKSAREAGVEERLMEILRGSGVGREVLEPTVEALKLLKQLK